MIKVKLNGHPWLSLWHTIDLNIRHFLFGYINIEEIEALLDTKIDI